MTNCSERNDIMLATTGARYQCIQCGKLFQLPVVQPKWGWSSGDVLCPACGGGYFNVLPAAGEPPQPHGNPFYRDDPREKPP